MHSRRLTVLLAASLLVAACSGSSTEEGGQPESIRLLAHDSFAQAVTAETFASFEARTGIAVEVIAAGDAGTLVNQAVLTRDNPIADVIYGVDDTFLSRALDNDLFIPYRSELLSTVPEALILDPENHVTPIDFGDVCINYDKSWFDDGGLELPQTLEDLTAKKYASVLTVEHPATSSPGLAFMLATIDQLGEENWLGFWKDLRDGGVRVVPDWDTAYYAEFRPYGGTSSMVVSYASSPPAEVIFSSEPLEEAPTGVIDPGCYRQVEFAGVVAGTPYEEAGGQLIDFMLSVEFQSQIPLTWFVFPANSDTPLPDEFVLYTTLPDDPSQMDPVMIAENRDRWIREWVAVMEG